MIYKVQLLFAACVLGLLFCAACSKAPQHPAETPPSSVTPSEIASLEGPTPAIQDESSSSSPWVDAGPSPTPGMLAFTHFIRTLEMIQTPEDLQNYSEQIAGKRIENWIGRVQQVTQVIQEEKSETLVTIDMNHDTTTLETGVPDLALKGLSQNTLEKLKPGMIINFSGTMETVADVDLRQNALILRDATLFGIGN